jgi:hypothetical protein
MRHTSHPHLASKRLPIGLLLFLLAGLAGGVAPIARAAGGTVVMEIFQADAINRGSDVAPIFPWAIQQDFYPRLSIFGGAFEQGPQVEQRDRAVWDPAFKVEKVFADVSDLAGNNSVSGVVELLDDDVDPDGDELFDINAAPAQRLLRLQLDVCSLRFSRFEEPATKFTGASWMLQGQESDPGAVQVRMRTADGKPFLPNNLAIADATPVQAVFHPRFIVENKATAFKLDLASSHTVPVNANVTVQMSDGITTVIDSKAVVVPPEGARVFLFDGSGSAGPFGPRKQANLRRLSYTVTLNVPADSNAANPTGPFPNCVASADNTLSGSLPVIATISPRTLYLPWDWGSTVVPGDSVTPRPPTVAQVRATALANERFRKAIFPVANVVAAVFPGFATSPRSLGEPGPTIFGWSVAAHIAGIDRLVLMPRNNWFSEEAGRLDFGDTAIGMSLAEFAPRAVLAEQGFSEVAVHEQGHTFLLSRRTCSTGGFAELAFGLGCRDEYNHAAADGAPYRADGFDVLGEIYPSGSGGATGTREVQGSVNFMDTTGALDGGAYDRWIDNLSYDWLSERLRSPQDPPLINISGYVRVPGGLDAPSGIPTGKLGPAYRYDGVPDLAEALLGGSSGEGRFAVRLVTPQSNRTYWFTPLFKAEGQSTQGYGYFAFAVPWDPDTTSIELIGPKTPGDIAPDPKINPQPQNAVLDSRAVSKATPTATRLRAGVGKAPDLSGSTYTPPVVGLNKNIVIAWNQADGDTPAGNLTAMLYLIPPKSSGLSAVASAVPIAVNISGGQVTISARQLASLPGDYGARVVISDGVNTTVLPDVAKLFSVRNGTYLPLTRR